MKRKRILCNPKNKRNSAEDFSDEAETLSPIKVPNIAPRIEKSNPQPSKTPHKRDNVIGIQATIRIG